jgi:hypothetical protein
MLFLSEDEANITGSNVDSSNPLTLTPLTLLKYDTNLSEKLKKEREDAEACSLKQTQSFYSALSISTNSSTSSLSAMSPIKLTNAVPLSPDLVNLSNENRKTGNKKAAKPIDF